MGCSRQYVRPDLPYLVIIWIPFPTILPVNGTNMNYAGVILLAIIICGIADWFISGHKRFEFPENQERETVF